MSLSSPTLKSTLDRFLEAVRSGCIEEAALCYLKLAPGFTDPAAGERLASIFLTGVKNSVELPQATTSEAE